MKTIKEILREATPFMILVTAFSIIAGKACNCPNKGIAIVAFYASLACAMGAVIKVVINGVHEDGEDQN